MNPSEFQEALQRVRNLAGNVALPTEPEPNPPCKRRPPAEPTFNWLYAGACRGYGARPDIPFVGQSV